MIKFSLLVFILLISIGCSSSGNSQTSSDTSDCVILSKSPQHNAEQSGEEQFNACLEQKKQTRDKGNSFWENSLEGLTHFVLDIIAT